MNAVLKGLHISLPLLVSAELAAKVQKIQVSALYSVGLWLHVSLALFSPAMSDIVFPVMANRTGSLVVLFHLV